MILDTYDYFCSAFTVSHRVLYHNWPTQKSQCTHGRNHYNYL